MDHEVAITALQPGSHRESESENESPPNPNATGNRITSMKDNTTNGSASTQEQFESGDEEDVSRVDKGDRGVGIHPTSSSDSQATNIDAHDIASTPPTSTSDGFSSQGTGQDSQISQLSHLSQLAAVQEPLNISTRPILTIAPTAGYKRTADGQVKSPTSPRVRGHSRNTSAVSTVSSSSRIGEVGQSHLFFCRQLTLSSYLPNSVHVFHMPWSR